MQLPYHDRYAYSPIVDRPDYSWPDGKRLAVYLGLNIEHFAFGAGEGHLLTVAGAAPDPRTFAWRDYGNRVGVWRCLELFDELNLPAAHLINTTVFDYAPRIVDALKARGDEFIGHGRTNAERHGHMWEADEKRFLQEIRDAIESASGKPPRGWMAPWMASTHHTPDLLKEVGFDFLMDWPADDQPLWMKTRSGPIMSVPYPIEINDSPQILVRHHSPERIPRLHHRPIRGAAAPVGQAAAGLRHRAAHDDRRSALPAAHAARGAAAHRQPSGEGQGVVHPAVGHLRPLRRAARGQISAGPGAPSAMTHFPVTALRSVDLETPDVGRSEQFYTSVWGLDLVTRHEGVTYLRASGTDHHVVALRQGERPALRAVTFRLHSDAEFEAIAAASQQHGATLPPRSRSKSGARWRDGHGYSRTRRRRAALCSPGHAARRISSIRKPADETGPRQSERHRCRWRGRVL